MAVLKMCIQCGKSYKTKPVYLQTARYCSIPCAAIGRSKKVPRNCLECGKEFLFKSSQLNAYKNAGKYCSRACGYKYRVIKTAAIPIKDKYGRSMRKADLDWKNAVREKDNFTCQRCGLYDKYIHTHHVASRARRPDLRHDITNGICLDAICHMWVHHHPAEAEKLGLLSGAKYEKDRLRERFGNISKSLTKSIDSPT